ncbi:FHA domain-containing protein [Vibrio sp. T187]|uniref:FHA domain-containing protein n=1 Tax=Vibrio TaxID=662 RepID=UPI0010C9BCBA|nr:MULTISPECIES: FHA domain-containing protein [Vibrio]MBW3696944.1 FHA domain-containing protein [Vibrio sp. T187]
MSISVHMISVPAEEVVTSRVTYLPEAGGSLGRSPSCDIALPDQSKNISRVHSQISLTDRGYVVKDVSNNGMTLNDKALIRDKEYPVTDGDIIKVGSYTLLISMLNNPQNTVTETVADDDSFLDGFDLKLDDGDVDFLDDMPELAPEKPKPTFSSNNVLSDDPFASDPFEDLEEAQVAPNVEIDEISHSSEAISAPSDLEYLPVNVDNNTRIEESIDKLITLTEKNQQYLQNPQLQQKALFEALEKTVDQFLNEFAPTQLENQFSEYVSSGMFSNKEKKYWKIYRKHFQHRQDNGDFRRQFKALFMENMQKHSEERE